MSSCKTTWNMNTAITIGFAITLASSISNVSCRTFTFLPGNNHKSSTLSTNRKLHKLILSLSGGEFSRLDPNETNDNCDTNDDREEEEQKEEATANNENGQFILPPTEIELNLQSHAAEIKENKDYYMGPCSTLEPSQMKTIGYDVGNVTLPDFNEQFHQSQGNNLIHVTSQPLLTKNECDTIIQIAEDHFAATSSPDNDTHDQPSSSNWTTLPSGRFQIAGTWIKDIPALRPYFNSLLKNKLFPYLAHLFPHVVSDPSQLCIQSAYLFKYTPESGEKTDMHMDSSLLSFTILLNDEDEFDGGGTFYESLGDVGEVVMMQKGQVTFRPAGLRHRGQPITKGKRYVIGGFVTVSGPEGCEHTRQLLTRGTHALQASDTTHARKLFELARDNSPSFSETYMSVAHCLRKFGDDEGALRSYKEAFNANPRNADSAFMVGVMFGERGDDEASLRWLKVASRLNEYDGDAWYRQGLIYNRAGLTQTEREMYQKAISVQPHHADAYCNLGCSYGESGNVEKEIECYEKALDIEPENEDALNNAKAAYYFKGIHAYRAGDLDTSLSSFRRILEGIAPGEPTITAAYRAVLEVKNAKETEGKS